MIRRIAMKILNEASYLPASLHMWMPYADSLLVIEGVDRYMHTSVDPGRVTSEGLSTDGTTEIIESFPDPEGKIEHVKLGFYQEEEDSIQRFMDGLKAGDILWTTAPDEFFFIEDIEFVLNKLQEGSCLTVRFPFRTYWHDFYHLLRGGGWDNELARVFVLGEDAGAHGMKMVGKGVTLCDSQGRDYNHEYYSGKTWTSPAMLHHFSYVREPIRIMEKLCWALEVEEKFSTATEDSPITGPARLDSYTLRKQYKTASNFARRTFPFFTNEYDERYNIYVERYEGPWPEVLVDHKYKTELIWDEGPVSVGG